MWSGMRETINLKLGKQADQLKCAGGRKEGDDWKLLVCKHNGGIDILSIMIAAAALFASSLLLSRNGHVFSVSHIHAVMRARAGIDEQITDAASGRALSLTGGPLRSGG